MVEAGLGEAEEEALVEQLAGALEALLDRTCAEMVPLWLESTRAARSMLRRMEGEDTWQPSARYLQLGKASRSKYRSLAVWRHAALWHDLLPGVGDDDYRRAVTCVYFTPFPSNLPPYAWSSAGRDAPGVAGFEGPSELKKLAKEGAYAVTQALLDRRRRWSRGATWWDVALMDLTDDATRPTIRDVLKLEDHPPFQEDDA